MRAPQSIVLFSFCFLVGCAATTPATLNTNAPSDLSFAGSFQSVQGVMEPLSCYCGNGGYITTATNEKIAVCFSDAETVKTCKTISVKGSYTTKKVTAAPNNPCPTGEMRFLQVSSYQC